MNYEERDPYGMYKVPSARGDADSRGPGPMLMGADTLIGNDVRNSQNENLGNIKEIMLDTHSGHIAYAVLAFGGFLGMGETLFAVPWRAMTLDTQNKCFVLDVDKDQLKNAPGFDKDNWPDMADKMWSDRVHSFYGTEPYLDNDPQAARDSINTPHGDVGALRDDALRDDVNARRGPTQRMSDV